MNSDTENIPDAVVSNGRDGDNGSDDSSVEILIVCEHCGQYFCAARDLEPTLNSMFDTYNGWKTNRQIRYLMYKEAVRVIHGDGLGKGVRKKLPACVENMIRDLAPDDHYTGFIDNTEDN